MSEDAVHDLFCSPHQAWRRAAVEKLLLRSPDELAAMRERDMESTSVQLDDLYLDLATR